MFRVASHVKVDSVASSPEPDVEAPVAVEDEVSMEDALEKAALETSEPVPSGSTAPPAAEPVLESSGDPKLDRLIAKRIVASPPIPPTTCLFCTHASASVQESAVHMRAAHSFVIPEQEFLVDLEGLLRRLGEEVGTWNVCICCSKGYGGNINLDTEGLADEELAKRASKGVEAVRNHMKSKVRARSLCARS